MDVRRLKIDALLEAERSLLRETEEASQRAANASVTVVFIGTIPGSVFGAFGVRLVRRNMLRHLGGEPAESTDITDAIAGGKLHRSFDGDSGASAGVWSSNERMISALRDTRDRTEAEAELKTALCRLDDAMRGEPSVTTLPSAALCNTAVDLDAQVDAI